MAANYSSGKSLNERVQTHEDGSQEFWRDVPGYAGFYRVSSWGRVKSLSRKIRTVGKKGGVNLRTISGQYLKLLPCPSGHVGTSLSKYGKNEGWLVHRLVLFAFVGPCPEGLECCHEDDNPTNNHIENLRWGTRSSNMADRVRNGIRVGNKGEQSGMAKLTDAIVLEMRRAHRAGEKTIREMAREHGITAQSSHAAITGVTWKHLK